MAQPQPQDEPSNNPFAGGRLATQPVAPSTGLISVEQQRAIAEVQARMIIARTNPRNRLTAMDAILEDCRRTSLAEMAVYQYARGGTDIKGESIKLMEAIATRWGNISSGFKEISRANGVSDILVEAWDLETGFHDYRQFQVKHWRDTKSGGHPLRDERDIYELIANQAQRRKREVLRTVIGRDVVEAAVAECERTLAARADVTPEGQRKLLDAFAEFGVSRAQIEARIQRRIDAISPAQVVSLKKVYASLRDDMSVPGDWFDPILTREPANDPSASPEAGAPVPAAGNAGLKERMQSMRNRNRRPSPEQERTGEVPTKEGPTVDDALTLVANGDDDAAADIAQGLGNGAVKRVLDAIKERKDRESGGAP